MALDLDQLDEIKKAAATPTSFAESEKLRGFIGTLLDELSITSGMVGVYTQREIDKEGCFGNAGRLEDLRNTRRYADNIVRGIHGGRVNR